MKYRHRSAKRDKLLRKSNFRQSSLKFDKLKRKSNPKHSISDSKKKLPSKHNFSYNFENKQLEYNKAVYIKTISKSKKSLINQKIDKSENYEIKKKTKNNEADKIISYYNKL